MAPCIGTRRLGIKRHQLSGGLGANGEIERWAVLPVAHPQYTGLRNLYAAMAATNCRPFIFCHFRTAADYSTRRTNNQFCHPRPTVQNLWHTKKKWGMESC